VITAEGALDLPNLARLVGLWGGFDGASAAGLAPVQ
jgi:hypothetical protein